MEDFKIESNFMLLINLKTIKKLRNSSLKVYSDNNKEKLKKLGCRKILNMTQDMCACLEMF